MVDVVGFANSAPTPTTLTYNGRMLRQMNGVGMAGATAARPLGSRSGVRPGTSLTTVTASATTWTAGPFAGLADVMLAAESGAYPFSFDAVATGAVTAANASFPRRDAIFVQVTDPENGTTTPSPVRGYLAGTVNVGGTLVIAAVPAGAFVVADILVPIAGGGAPTVLWVAPYTVAAGARLPVQDAAALAAYAPMDGQEAYQIDTKAVHERVAGAWVARDVTWQTPTLNAGWTHEAGNPFQFSKKNGVVFFRGRASSTGASVAFTLPVGFRPDVPAAQAFTFSVDAGGPVRFNLPPTGAVTALTAGSLSNVSFAGFSFIAGLL